MAKASIKPHGEGACPHRPQAGRAVAPRPPQLVEVGGRGASTLSDSAPTIKRVVCFEDFFADDTRNGFKIPQSEYATDGSHIIIDQGDNEIAGYSDREDGLYTSVPVVVFGDHTRIVKYVNRPFFLGADGVKILKPKEGILPLYSFYALKAARIEPLGYSRHFKLVKEIRFPLPPIPEQKRIAAILDKICEMKRNAEARLQKLDLLVKARFVEMFGDAIGSFFPRVALGDLCVVKSGGTPDRSMPEYWNNGTIPWVKTTELQNQKINRTSECITEKGLQESSAKLVPAGTILLAMYGQGKTRGMTAMLDIAAATNQACACIIPSEKVDNDYLWRYLILSYDKIRAQAQGAGQPNLNGQMVRSFLVPLPPLALQRQFAAFVEKVEGLKATAKKELEQVDLLYRAKLQEFFG